MKGQVTIFVILAIVVMIAFGFVFFLMDYSRQSALNEQADQALAEYTNSINLKTLVQSCIRTNTNYALWLAGNQGGVISTNQKGTQPLQKYSSIYENNEFDVLTEINISYWIFDGFTPPYLCDLNGPNRPGSGSAGRAATCLIRESYSTHNNLQNSITNYIKETVNECVNLEAFITKKGTVITAATPKTQVVFAENSLTVLVEYPFNISVPGEETEFKSINFTYNSMVRLQKVYNLAYEIAGNINANTNFVLETEYQNLRFYDDGLVVQKVLNFQNATGTCTAIDCTNDLIWIKDEKSNLYGDAYIFKYAIKDGN